MCGLVFLYGGKASLGIAFTIIGISGAIGIAIGGLAGFSTPSIDRWLSRLIDLVLGFPNMVIAIAFIGIMGPSITNVIISLCITKWADMPVSREASYRLNATRSILPLLVCQVLQIYESYGATFCRMYCHRW